MASHYIVFPQARHADLWQEPEPQPGPGEILCRAEQSLISIGTELSCLRGVFEEGTNWADWVRYPFRPGYSMAARVVKVGQGVTEYAPGDRVSAWVEHQQYFTARPEAVHRIPDGVSSADATWSILACTTQLGVRRAELKLGETVAVVGLGILGQLVVQYAALSGARRIIAIDPAPQRLELALSHGATHGIAATAAEALPEVERMTGGKMLDALFEISGRTDVLPTTFPLLRKLGRIVLLGDTPTPSQIHLGPGVVSNSLAILSIHGSMMPEVGTVFNPWTADEMAQLFFDYLLQGRMRVADLVTRVVSPPDAAQVYGGLLQNSTADLGILFDWQSLPD